MDRELDIRTRRARTFRRAGGGLAALGAIGALLVLGPGWLRPSVRRSNVRISAVERGDLEATLRASGIVVPAFERVLSSPVDARVLRKLKQPGAVLEAGDAILELDTTATRLEIEKIEERLAQNENERTQRRLETENEIAGLEREIETQKLELEIARYRLSQNRKLYDEDLVSEERFKESEVTVKKTEIRLRQLDEEILAARETHKAQVERLDLDAGILRRELEDKLRQLDLAMTRAEGAGVLTWVVDEAGSTVRSGDLLARIADLGSFRVEATISDAYAPRLEVGQAVHVVAGEDSIPARLSRILPTIENGAVRFDVDLEDPSHPRLRHNLRVDVMVVTGFKANVLKIPRGPYIQGGGVQHQVFVVRGDRAARTEVRLGLLGYEFYEVLEGLDEGDEVIVSDVRRKLHATEIRVK
jgi:HlyD family secretion protein